MEQQHLELPNDREYESALATKALLEFTGGVYDSNFIQAPTLLTQDRDGTALLHWQAVVQITIPDKGSRCGTGTAPSDHSPLEAVDNAFIDAVGLFGIHPHVEPPAQPPIAVRRRSDGPPVITAYNVAALSCLKRFHHEHHCAKTWYDAAYNRDRTFGQAFHKVMAQVMNPLFATPPETRFLVTWCEDAVREHPHPDPKLAQEDVQRCLQVVRAAIDASDDAADTLATEKQFWVTVRDEDGTALFVLRPRADRVVHRDQTPNTITIVDYKVAKDGFRRQVGREQAALLLAAADTEYVGNPRLGNICNVAFETWWVDSEDGRVTVEVLQAHELRETYDFIKEKMMRYLAAQEFPAEPYGACPWCPLFDVCPEAQPVNASLARIDRLFGLGVNGE